MANPVAAGGNTVNGREGHSFPLGQSEGSWVCCSSHLKAECVRRRFGDSGGATVVSQSKSRHGLSREGQQQLSWPRSLGQRPASCMLSAISNSGGSIPENQSLKMWTRFQIPAAGELLDEPGASSGDTGLESQLCYQLPILSKESRLTSVSLRFSPSISPFLPEQYFPWTSSAGWEPGNRI